jgi:predicted transcriptional regulator
MSASDVLAELGGGLAYTTVMTTLTRLHAKGVLTREPAGRAYVYATAGDPEQFDEAMAAHRMRRVLDGGVNHAGVLARFVSDLSPEDAQTLAKLLRDDPTRESRS